MPIRGYAEHGVVFSPDSLSAMGKAFEAATEILGIGGDEINRQSVAQFIIGLAEENCTLDAETLRDRAVAAFGYPIRAASICTDRETLYQTDLRARSAEPLAWHAH